MGDVINLYRSTAFHNLCQIQSRINEKHQKCMYFHNNDHSRLRGKDNTAQIAFVACGGQYTNVDRPCTYFSAETKLFGEFVRTYLHKQIIPPRPVLIISS